MGKLTQETINLIKQFEGLRLEAYQDSAGVWTIGYGHTKGVHRGMKVTKSGAEQLLVDDLAVAVAGVNRTIKRPTTDYEFGAFVSLTHNIGVGAFSKSTAAREFNANDKVMAGKAILMWNKITVSGKKVVSNGLVNRRLFERDYFSKIVVAPDIQPSAGYETTAGEGGEKTSVSPVLGAVVGGVAAGIVLFWDKVEAFFANLF